MSELRPCIITTESWEPNRSETVKINALFHSWIRKCVPAYSTEPCENWLLRKVIGTEEMIVAIVEYGDGTIHEHYMSEIQFIDGLIKEYAFPEHESED